MRNDLSKSNCSFFKIQVDFWSQRREKLVLSHVFGLMRYDCNEWGLWMLVQESLDFGSTRTDYHVVSVSALCLAEETQKEDVLGVRPRWHSRAEKPKRDYQAPSGFHRITPHFVASSFGKLQRKLKHFYADLQEKWTDSWKQQTVERQNFCFDCCVVLNFDVCSLCFFECFWIC